MIRELVDLIYREQVPLSQLIGHAPIIGKCRRSRTVEILVMYLLKLHSWWRWKGEKNGEWMMFLWLLKVEATAGYGWETHNAYLPILSSPFSLT